MPKLWSETVDAHRREVRNAILDAAARLIADRGVLAVTMSHVAELTGIGRATLYKYYPDVESILVAWHGRHIAHHIEELTALRDRVGEPEARLEAVLSAYALICFHRVRHGGDIAALVHRDEHVAAAQRQLLGLFGELLAEAAEGGLIRDDLAPDELANYCFHALTAAGALRSEAAVNRLVSVTLAGLRACGEPAGGPGRASQ